MCVWSGLLRVCKKIKEKPQQKHHDDNKPNKSKMPSHHIRMRMTVSAPATTTDEKQNMYLLLTQHFSLCLHLSRCTLLFCYSFFSSRVKSLDILYILFFSVTKKLVIN